METNSRPRAFLDLARALFRLDRTVLQVVEGAATEAAGLAARETFVLSALEHGDRRPGEIARRLDMAAPSVTRTVEALVRRGLVQRSRDGGDRRAVHVTLTPEGIRELAQAREAASRALADAWPELPAARAEALAQELAALAAAKRCAHA